MDAWWLNEERGREREKRKESRWTRYDEGRGRRGEEEEEEGRELHRMQE